MKDFLLFFNFFFGFPHFFFRFFSDIPDIPAEISSFLFRHSFHDFFMTLFENPLDFRNKTHPGIRDIKPEISPIFRINFFPDITG